MNALEAVYIDVHAFKCARRLVNGPFARASDEATRDIDGLAGIGIEPRIGTEYSIDAVVIESTLETRSLKFLAVDLEISLRHPLACGYIL